MNPEHNSSERHDGPEATPADGPGKAVSSEARRIREGFVVFNHPQELGGLRPAPVPASALPDVAAELAASISQCPAGISVSAERVLACLERLIEAEFSRRRAAARPSTISFESGLPNLLFHALSTVSPDRALEFCETEDLRLLDRRTRVAQCLGSGYAPLLSLDELGRVLSQFIEHQSENREVLVSTGIPKTHFQLIPWLDIHLNKLYFTKIPVRLSRPSPRMGVRSPSWQAKSYSRLFDARRIAFRTTVSPPEMHDGVAFLSRLQSERTPPALYTWARLIDGRWTACNYNEVEHLNGLSSEDIKKLDQLRPVLFDTKMRILCKLVEGIQARAHEKLLEHCFQEITKRLLVEDVDFLLTMDQFYSGYNVRINPSGSSVSSNPMLAGGLTSLLEVIGHVKKELSIGTLAKTRNAMGEALVFDGLQCPRFITAVDRPFAYYRDRNDTYLELCAAGYGEHARRGFDLCAELDALEPAFWHSFIYDVDDSLKMGEFNTNIQVRAKWEHALIMLPTVQRFADYLSQQMDLRTFPPIQLTDSNVFRFCSTETWEIQYEGGPFFALPHVDGLAYLCHLITHKEKSFTGLEMKACLRTYGSSIPQNKNSDVDTSEGFCAQDTVGPKADEQTLKETWDQLREYDHDIERAKSEGRIAEVGLLEKERAVYEQHLRSYVNIKGDPRKSSTAETRAARTTKLRIQHAIELISKRDSRLGDHLKDAVDFNLFAYHPRRAIEWVT